ncbi:MAG: cytochrome b/b6 domain-containing protein [SAR324 cluster bacterium]|nr:cytochrome b/b6 domain-containing protein [SAR324 cluster bacterium]
MDPISVVLNIFRFKKGGNSRPGQYLKRIVFISLFLGWALVSHAETEADSEACVECHGGAKKDVSLVTPAIINKSVHEGTECLECHADIKELPHAEKLTAVKCGGCHEDATEAYKRHGMFEVGSGHDIPNCADCHGTHNIITHTDKRSAVHPLNLPATCGKCHEDPDLTKLHTFLPKKPVQTYQASVHGKATAGGIYTAATCNDCHSSNGTAHQIFAPGNPLSTINHFTIPKTCGQCHESIEKDYWEGIHGQLVARGQTDSPVCTNCHGEHSILAHGDKRSPVSSSQLAEATCAPCHESATLTEKYGLPAGRLASFIDSYHGLKSKAGDITVANCASCHGAHRILPHEDPASSIHPNHLQETCGECHPGISMALATTRIHEDGGQHQQGVTYIVSIIYMIIIAFTISGMVLYVLLDFWRQTRQVMLVEQIRRMTRWEVLQHTMLMLTFIFLVITGFALRFSDSWWASLLFARDGGFAIRNLAHRISAVVFILAALAHLFYLFGNRGRTFTKNIFPRLSDAKFFMQMMKYNLGFSDERPKFLRFSFVEKVEYWALIWGSLIMIVTGLMLWEDNLISQYIPKGFLDVALVIHYYEAWLATLSILIWHFYSTIFNPSVYPMNPAWINGKMPKSQYQHEHGGDDIEDLQE